MASALPFVVACLALAGARDKGNEAAPGVAQHEVAHNIQASKAKRNGSLHYALEIALGHGQNEPAEKPVKEK